MRQLLERDKVGAATGKRKTLAQRNRIWKKGTLLDELTVGANVQEVVTD